MADTKTLPIKRFASSAAWDAWLRKHHTSSPGVWLEFAKKGRQSPPLSHAQALETALCYGWIDGQTASSKEGWWRQRFTRRGPRSKWSKINCGAVDRLRAQGRLTRSEEHTSELQSQSNLVCRLLLEKKKKKKTYTSSMYTTHP